jgi:hypothetical protein
MSNIPDQFDEAVARFGAFLQDNGHTGDILWIFADDLTSRATDTWVRWPTSDNNRDKTRQLYESLKNGSGIRFHARCRVREFICTTIAGPKPDDAQTGRFISGLTLSVTTPLSEAKPVDSQSRWKQLQMKNGIPPTSGVAAFIHEDA